MCKLRIVKIAVFPDFSIVFRVDKIILGIFNFDPQRTISVQLLIFWCIVRNVKYSFKKILDCTDTKKKKKNIL